jgi:hypothetical protein
MIEYCLTENIIQEQDIKKVLYSSLTVPANYFNPFIEYVYKHLDGDLSKLAVNGMIGSFKPKERENWKSLFITQDPNIAFHHYMQKKGCFIDSRSINDQNYYQVYNSYFTESQDTEAPIYNQIIDLEVIELHKLMNVVKNNNGYVLDVSTDCVTCVFNNDVLPFEIEDDKIKGFYFDDKNKVNKYKLEDKDGRLEVEILPRYTRKEVYHYSKPKFISTPDVEDNNFKPLIDLVLSFDKSVHLDGRAGCGKSTLVKGLQAELDSKNIKYISLAPTNKACRIIDGMTIHRFVAKNTSKTIKEMKEKYIFIDEVSMMSEIFYKYFIFIKRIRPDIKFIIAGDFAQLLPVKERIEVVNYKNSIALYELADGNRIQLTRCRRSDDTLFKMLLPENIKNLTRTDFNTAFTSRHISFTNKKRLEVNKTMMEKAVKANKKIKKVLELSKLSYDPNSQDVYLLSGMPIIARKNSKDLDIFNNETFMIKEIRHTKSIIIIEDEDQKKIEINFEDFQYLFYVAYCITVYKSQGQSFNHPYSIHEWDRYDHRMKYVALSRATTKDCINIV